MPAFKGKISDDDIKNLVKLIRKDFQGKQWKLRITNYRLRSICGILSLSQEFDFET
jgi:hypothetical protein